MIGWQAAQAFAFSLRKPVIGIHHHEAHLYSPWIEGQPAQARFDLPAFVRHDFGQFIHQQKILDGNLGDGQNFIRAILYQGV